MYGYELHIYGRKVRFKLIPSPQRSPDLSLSEYLFLNYTYNNICNSSIDFV